MRKPETRLDESDFPNGKVTSGVWHHRAIERVGKHIEVFFDGDKVIDDRDDTFKEAGKFGVWTKADSLIQFDDLIATRKKGGRGSARRDSVARTLHRCSARERTRYMGCKVNNSKIQLLYEHELTMAPGPILLISNSTQHRRGFLDHVEAELRDFLDGRRRVLFVPFALFDRAAYGIKARSRLASMGLDCEVLDGAAMPERAIDRAEAFFIGGGNTFRLLKALQDSGSAAAITRRVRAGAPYVGSSAGSIVAGPSLKTTKDMPIVQPALFEALSLVDFQISPHYLDPDPSSTHMGETQEERILQFLEENDAPVLGLREGGFVRVERGEVVVKGDRPARVFRRGAAAVEVEPGARLDRLLRRIGP